MLFYADAVLSMNDLTLENVSITTKYVIAPIFQGILHTTITKTDLVTYFLLRFIRFLTSRSKMVIAKEWIRCCSVENQGPVLEVKPFWRTWNI